MSIIFQDMSAFWILILFLCSSVMIQNTSTLMTFFFFYATVLTVIWCTAWSFNSNEAKKKKLLCLLPLLYQLEDLEKRIESTFIKFADNTKLYMIINLLEGRKILQRNLDSLNPWRESSCRRLNTAKCQVLHSGLNNSIQCHRCEGKWLESCSAEKDPEVLINSSWTWASCVPRWPKESKTSWLVSEIVASRTWEMIVSL